VLAGDGEMRGDLERAIARLGLGARAHHRLGDEKKVRELVLARAASCCRASRRACRCRSWRPSRSAGP
jgi:hypothetical protein